MKYSGKIIRATPPSTTTGYGANGTAGGMWTVTEALQKVAQTAWPRAPQAPGAATITSVSAGNAQATVTFTAPADTGGLTVTYTVTSSPGGITASGASSPITVTGLTNGTTYTFTVTATNSKGTSLASAASSSVTPISRDGSLTYPGYSAQDLYSNGITTSGWYYIQTSTMGSPKRVYCNMTDEGGGWMLVAYHPTFNSSANGLNYPNSWSQGEGTLNKLSVNTMDLWKNNGVAQCSQVLKMATTSNSQTPLLSNMVIANKVIYSNPSNLLLNTSGLTFVNNTPMTGTWYPVKGHTQMSSSLTINAPGDWLYNEGVSGYWTVCGPSNELHATGRSGNGLGTGSWTNMLGGDLYGVADVNATSAGNRSDIGTYAVFIK